MIPMKVGKAIAVMIEKNLIENQGYYSCCIFTFKILEK